MKAYADLEQSRKLAEILPLESADMTWEQITQDLTGDFTWEPAMGLNAAITYNLFSFRKGYILPCWSLAALLGVLHKIINNETLFIETSAALWHIGYRNVYIARADNPVNACVDMIEKLHEQKLL